ncbi:Tetratricopeptide repeat protein [Phycisphaerae bacterium RAS1]|nr:Tetratricopeptide repeat protein [Phycisphaerae bacterium RAS1]
MARQRVVNKNLVALLTILGIVFSVGAVGLVTKALGQQDPEKWAVTAREKEKAGDLEQAILLFRKAYEVSHDPSGGGKKDPKYLVEAAHCAHQFGEVMQALQLLRRVNAERPDNREAIESILEHLWQFKRYNVGGIEKDLRDFGDKLLKIDEKSLIGLLSRAAGGLAMRDDPDALKTADEDLKRAMEREPNNPRAAILRIERVSAGYGVKLRDLAAQRAGEAQARDARNEYLRQVEDVLKPAVAANPGDPAIVDLYCSVLTEQKRRDEWEAVLQKALAAKPDESDLHLATARVLLEDAVATYKTAEKPKLAAQLDRVIAEAARAVELEPANFDAHAYRARAMLMRPGVAGEDSAADPKNWEAALSLFETATKSHAARSARRRIAELRGEPLLMYVSAFRMSLAYPIQAGVADAQQPRVLWARKFLESCEARYPEVPHTSFMRGEFHIAEQNVPSAIRAFEKANRDEAAQRELAAVFLNVWGATPAERLAVLYRDHRQPGQALQFTEAALQTYTTRLRRDPPAYLVVNRAELLNQLDRAQDALDYITQMRAVYPDETRLAAAMAESYRQLKRPEDARRVLGGSEAGGVAGLAEARILALEGDFPAAEKVLRSVLEKEPQNRMALEALVRVLIQQEKRADAGEVIRGIIAKETDPEQIRMLKSFEVAATEQDAAKRDQQILALIQQQKDPLQREKELYNFEVGRGDMDAARQHLDAAEKLAPDDPVVQEFQYNLAIRRKDYDTAGRYVAKLSQLNYDQAGGATYRGEMAIARQDGAAALREFQEAERRLPASVQIKTKMARALVMLNRYPEALEYLKQGEALNPRNFAVQKLLFILEREEGDNDEAIRHLEAALRINANDPDLVKEKEFADEEKEPAAGIARREALRKEKPDDVDNLVRIGELAGKLARSEGAVANTAAADAARQKADEAFQAASAINPTHGKLGRSAARFYGPMKMREPGEKVLTAFREKAAGGERVTAEFLLGMFFEELGDVAKAESHFKEAARIAPEALEDADQKRKAKLRGLFELVNFYTRTGQIARMVEASRAVLDNLDSESKDDRPLVQEARVGIINGLLESRQLGDAEKEIDAYLKLFPDEPRGLVARARMQERRGDPRAAFDTLGKVIVIQPDNLWARYSRGGLAMQLFRYAEARDDLLKAKELADRADETSTQFRFQRPVRLRLAALYAVQQRYELSETELREIIPLLQGVPGAEMDLQDVASRLMKLYGSMQRPEKAEQLVTEFAARFPNEPYWPYQLGLMMLGKSQPLLAIAHFDKSVALSRGKNAQAFTIALGEKIRALISAKRPSDAVKDYEQETAPIKEMIPVTLKARASAAYAAAGDAAASAKLYEEALTQSAGQSLDVLRLVVREMGFFAPPTEVEAQMRALAAKLGEDAASQRLQIMLCWQLLGNNRAEDAGKVIDAVLERKDLKQEDKLGALMARAACFEARQQWEPAENVYREVLRERSDDLGALNNLAYLLLEHSTQFKEALKCAERAREILEFSPSSAVLDTVGWAYFKNGQIERAEASLGEALAADPEDLAALYHLGVLLSETKRSNEARVMLERLKDQAERQRNQEYMTKADEALKKL